MPLPSHFKRNLRRILRRFRAANGIVAVPDGSGKALEAWVLMRLAMTARASGNWTVSLKQGDGTPLPAGSPFEFATSQAGIQAASTSGPCHILLEHRRHPHKRLELHGSLQWRGRSGASHEIDVSALPASIGDALRGGSGGLPRGLPVVAIECKDRTEAATPDEVRQTLARMFDLALVTRPTPHMKCRTFEDVTGVSWGGWSSTYRAFFEKGTFAIVRAGKFSSGAQLLATHYHIARVGEVYGARGTSLSLLEAHFRRTLAELDRL